MLSLKPGDTFADNYRLIRLVDTGGFAEVWQAEFLSAGNIVALKIFPQMDPVGVKDIEEEYRSQADLLHSNLLIARYFGKYENRPYLEMRFCGGGNASKNNGKYTEAELAKCIHQVSSAMAYLHTNDIIHQDIKPNNFLLDNTGNYYLADLGLSIKVRKTIQRLTEAKSGSQPESTKVTSTGSTPPPYRAPELWDRTKQAVKATDIWALGASVYEMTTGDMPFGEWGGVMQMNNPEPPDFPAGYSAELSSIIKKCLSKETYDRPKAADIADWTNNYIRKGSYGVSFEPTPEPPTVIPQPTAKSPLKMIIAVLVLVIIGVGIYWYISHQGSDKTVVTKPSVDSPAKPPVEHVVQKPNISDQNKKPNESEQHAAHKVKPVDKSGLTPVNPGEHIKKSKADQAHQRDTIQ